VKDSQTITSSALDTLSSIDEKTPPEIRAILLLIAQQSRNLSLLLTTLDHITLDDSSFMDAYSRHGGVDRLITLLYSWKQGISPPTQTRTDTRISDIMYTNPASQHSEYLRDCGVDPKYWNVGGKSRVC
jgi:hypothetical protein